MNTSGFRDRQEAGLRLSEVLQKYKGENVVVYALPRGGVPVGLEVAKALEAPLDLVITRKIGHPDNPEFAVCAVAEDGEVLCDEQMSGALDEAWLKAEVEKGRTEAKRRREVYLTGRQHVSAKGKIAIVVDDGVATGLTARVAVQTVRSENPSKLIVAIPCAPYEVAEELRTIADEVIVLTDEKSYLGAVGAYYDEFPQLSDEEVVRLLAEVS